MSRGRGSLKAVLTQDRAGVVCGRCGDHIAFVATPATPIRRVAGDTTRRRRPTWDQGAGDDERGHVVFDTGWLPRGRDGVWVLPADARRRITLGWAADKHRSTIAQAGRCPSLPTAAECRRCDSVQELDPDALDVRRDPGHESHPLYIVEGD